MKKLILMSLCILTFTNICFAGETNNIAVVDLQKIVNQSSQVKALRQEQMSKIQELNSIVLKAQAEIAKENDIKKIVEIQDKYTNEFNNKKSNIEKIYNEKITQIEQKIINDIEKTATSKGYDIVFAKSVVLYGGKDITNEVSSSKY